MTTGAGGAGAVLAAAAAHAPAGGLKDGGAWLPSAAAALSPAGLVAQWGATRPPARRHCAGLPAKSADGCATHQRSHSRSSPRGRALDFYVAAPRTLPECTRHPATPASGTRGQWAPTYQLLAMHSATMLRQSHEFLSTVICTALHFAVAVRAAESCVAPLYGTEKCAKRTVIISCTLITNNASVRSTYITNCEQRPKIVLPCGLASAENHNDMCEACQARQQAEPALQGITASCIILVHNVYDHAHYSSGALIFLASSW